MDSGTVAAVSLASENANRKFIEENSFSHHGMEIMYWSDPNPIAAVINFTSMNPGKFERWSWFHQRALDRPMLYIFLKDEDCHFYLGASHRPKALARQAMISLLLWQHGIKKVDAIAVGSSMGGYGAIRYALEMGLGAAIGINPQVDRVSAELHNTTLWTRKMDESYWSDLDQVAQKALGSKTYIHLIAGSYAADAVACAKLESALAGAQIDHAVERVEAENHGWVGMSSDRLRAVLNDFAWRRDFNAWPGIAGPYVR